MLSSQTPIKVVVASKNPVKINAVKIGFEKVFPETKFEFVGVSAASEVPDQPMTNNQTLQGAINRANNAQKEIVDADYYVGLEGGLEKTSQNEMEVFAWIVIKSDKKLTKARTSTFFLPQKIIELIDQGMELGHADDLVFGRTNSKQQTGTVGVLTHNLITRTDYYVEPVVLALIPFINPELY
jgi:inosine/xanthosine triphosphatase